MKVKNGPITRAQRRKIKMLEDNGMVAFFEEALKSKLQGFEGQERATKLFSMCSISKDQSREQIGGEIGKVLEGKHPTANDSPASTVASRLLPAPSLEVVENCLPITFVCNLIVWRLDFSQGCLELKKEEQFRATK
ncbi:hypothetical protein M9H77_11909 [Catharanthus roseus]|uniref:Uncharacterized protein n=1 Tax=Catharanthus roseus TaxID=4058 RepID=A0ACC0BFY5_CATRO|nr:hypothetical protein M9H77_11909 [Catharanthus roseus]